MAITLRTAQSNEASTVLTFWRQSDAQPTNTDDVVSIERLLTFDSGALILAEEDERLVGCVVAAWDGWRGNIYRLCVAPSYRRQGLGQRLLVEAERRLKEMGAVRLAGIVDDDDDRAIRFWRTSGWQEQVHRSRFVKG